jgi:hypothetical protein
LMPKRFNATQIPLILMEKSSALSRNNLSG